MKKFIPLAVLGIAVIIAIPLYAIIDSYRYPQWDGAYREALNAYSELRSYRSSSEDTYLLKQQAFTDALTKLEQHEVRDAAAVGLVSRKRRDATLIGCAADLALDRLAGRPDELSSECIALR